MSAEGSAYTIFNNALELTDAAERSRYIADACAGDAVLLERVEKLLRAHEEAGGFFSEPSQPRGAASETLVLPRIEKAGDTIGRYKLLEQIGEGGCGVVYMAEQLEPLRRRVALKVIKLGMDTRQVVARFEAERQALALMDHPNIAKVLDAGATESGRPFFVMELVRGRKITEFCDDKKLSTEERLKLFVSVCQAVQHAHQKGIIHRDIKPSNILVTTVDGAPVPKVIDFGIAKATGNQPLTDKTLFTAFEQFIGTPAYMSPEQAEMSGVDVDTRTDLYSLGVVLYELLTGQTPFDAQALLRSGIDHIRRTIRDQEPPKPSTRLHQLPKRELTTTAQVRHTDAHKLLQTISGDLDWIVMKCLEKDRGRRYETVNGLALDVQRYLNNDLVTARPPSRWYAIEKTVRRHKFGFAAAAAVMLALSVGLAVSTWQFIQKNRAFQLVSHAEEEQKRQRLIAETKEKQSEQVAEFLKEMLTSVGPSVALGRDTALLKEVLGKTASRVQNDLRDQPAVEAELLATLGNVYLDLGDYTNAAALLESSTKLRQQLHGGEHLDVASTLSDLGVAYRQQGKLVEAENLEKQALAIQIRLAGSDNLAVARSIDRLGESLRRQLKYADAESNLLHSLALRTKLLGSNHTDVAESLFHLGLLFNLQNKGAIAERYFRQCIEIQRSIHGPRHPGIADALDSLGLALTYERRFSEAEKTLREAIALTQELFPEPHPVLAYRLHNLGFTLRNAGRADDAEPKLREALALRRKLLDPGHPEIATTLIILSDVERQRGHLAESESLIREAIVIRKKLFGENDARLVSSVSVLAWVLRAQGKLAEADACDRELQALRKKTAPAAR